MTESMNDERERSLLVRGGAIHPMDGPAGSADAPAALVVRGGRILATGTVEDMSPLAGDDAEVLDVGGATVLPGLIDTHPHLLHYGSLAEPLVDIADARSHDEIVERIRARAARTPPGDWVMTTPVGEAHYFIRSSYRDLPEGTLPARDVLDRATTEHPVVIQAWAPATPNSMALNSAALARLGIDADTPERVDNVWIEKDADGLPTGRLHGSVNNYYSEDPYCSRLWRQIPFLQPDALVPGTKRAVAEYLRQGVTAVYENHMMDGPLIDTWRGLRDAGELTMRVAVAQEAEAYGMPWSRPRPMEDFMARLQRAADSIETHDDFYRFVGVSVMLDGGCNGGFIRMRRAYKGPYGEEAHGHDFITLDKAELVMRFAAEHHMRLNIIALGPAAHDDNLAMLDRVAEAYDITGLGWILVHGFFVEPEHVEHYARLGFDVTISMSFTFGKGDMLVERIGADVMDDFLPLRRFLDAGMAVAAGTDWGPKNPWEQIQLALTHEFAGSGRRNLGPAQTVTREEAVAMWTSGGSRLLRWPEIGTLAPSTYADMIVVDRDPLTADLDDLPGTRVLRTIVDGQVVHDSGDLGG